VPAPPSDNLTKFLAARGAILSTFGLGWTLYRDLLDRAKLQVSARVRRLTQGADGKWFAISPDMEIHQPVTQQLFVIMTVVNVGRRPVVWQGWGGKYRKKEDEKPAFYIVGQHLPKMLQEGESHAEMTPLGQNLEPASDNVKKLYVWDPAGREWALSRKQLKKLREEARKAVATAP